MERLTEAIDQIKKERLIEQPRVGENERKAREKEGWREMDLKMAAKKEIKKRSLRADARPGLNGVTKDKPRRGGRKSRSISHWSKRKADKKFQTSRNTFKDTSSPLDLG